MLKAKRFKMKMPRKPNPTPNSAPNPTCEKSMPTISPAPIAPAPCMPYFAASTAVKTTVSMYEAGSFDPDSISSRDEVWYFKFSLRERRILNTDAASVEQMTEPMSMLSTQPMPPKGSSRKMHHTPTPTSPAVRAVPAKDKSSALPATGFASLKLVPNPP